MSSIGFDGGAIAPSGASSPVSSAELMRLVFESGSDLNGLEWDTFSNSLRQNLLEAIQQRGEVLTQSEREAIERGTPQEIKALLEALRRRAAERAAQSARSRDGLTQTRLQAPEAPTLDHLPEGEALSVAELLHLIYEAPTAQASAAIAMLHRWTQAQRLDLVATLAAGGEPLSAAERDGSIPALEALLRKIIGRSRSNDGADAPDRGLESRAEAYGKLRPGNPRDPGELAEVRRQLLALILKPGKAPGKDGNLLGTAAATVAFADGFPGAGRSGQAHTVPIMQFLPGGLHAAARSLGIHTLVDFLARVRHATARFLTGRALGLPPTAMILAGLRAELLDLPLKPGAKRPHLKDILLMSRLGVGTPKGFAALHEVFEKHPSRLNLLADLLAALQKALPHWVGRDRITRHELRAWCMAGANRGSDVVAPPSACPGQSDIELASEKVLLWVLGQRWSEPEVVWQELILRLLGWMWNEGIPLPQGAQRQLVIECGVQQVDAWEDLLRRRATQDDLARWDLEQRLYEEYLRVDTDISILSDLTPGQVPDDQRRDRMVCFWVDPAVDAKHVLQPGGPGTPESVRAVYVCMDPESGAVVPFGG